MKTIYRINVTVSDFFIFGKTLETKKSLTRYNTEKEKGKISN